MKEKSHVLSSLLWRFSERMLAQTVTFIVSAVLARLLDPSHYGVIALTTVFITFGSVFINGGFASTLIKKKTADNIDFSSVLYFNLFISIITYTVVFCIAPFVAQFYQEPALTAVLRVLALKFPISALNIVQYAYVSKNMMFKRFFYSTLIGTVISSIIGIYMAYSGYGVWALVAQYLSNTLIDTLVLWFTVKWRPDFVFKFNRIKEMLGFSSNIFITNLINATYNNLRNLIIGKLYTVSDLAFYSKGIRIPQLIMDNVNTTVGSVIYPVFSKLQDEKKQLKSVARRTIKLNTLIFSSLMTILFITAPEIVAIVYTEKWLPCVPYIRIACVYFFLYSINTIKLQAILALGEGKAYSTLNIIKKGIGTVLIFASIPFGIIYMAGSEIVSALIAVLINIFALKKVLHYTYSELFQDLWKSVVVSIAIATLVLYLSASFEIWFHSIYIIFIVKLSLIGLLQFIFLRWLHKDEIDIIKNQIKALLKGGRGNDENEGIQY